MMYFLKIFTFMSSALMLCSFGEVIVDLTGEWIVEDENGKISTGAIVPGSAHTALRSKGIIDDPYFRFNDLQYRWIAYTNWTFSRVFQLPTNISSLSTIQLVCEGLDTVSRVFVNGQQVGTSDNMFRRYIYNIEKYVNPGKNNITVKFESAVAYAERQAAAHFQYNVPPACNPPEFQGFCHPNYIRKEQCSFSWDWGPAFAPVGIWRNISISAFQAGVVRDVVATPIPSGSRNITWSLNVTTHIETGKSSKPIEGTLTVNIPALGIVNKNSIKLKSGLTSSFNVYFDAPMAKTWWPIGYGAQPLYDVSVTFTSTSGEVSSKNVTIGFRKVQIVQDSLPSGKGSTFYFKINDQYIFMKGTNWIPVDAFQERVTIERLENLFDSVVDANMNMLRVWGGGIYEQEAFYRLADKNGILVWQDAMFACAMYPTGDKFLDSVREEIKYQVRRINNHPSVVAWGANNENEKALRQNWYGTKDNFTLYKEDYIKLYIHTVRQQYLEEYTNVPIISSSPSNGIETEKEGWVANNPADPLFGDIHFYDYYSDCWNVSTYEIPRFASEYGFQSLPSFSTMAHVSKSSDWSYDSNFSIHRQHHPKGNSQMLSMIKKYFEIPKTNDTVEDYKNIIYLTQVSQAMCIKVETEHYRRYQSSLDESNQGMTRGALYWQLNDIWQAPTWASTEYGGKWKMLHYFAMDFFEPLLASGYISNGQLYVYVISDLVTPLNNATLAVKVWSWDSFTPKLIQNVTFDLEPQSSALMFSEDSDMILSMAGCTSETCFFTFEVMMENRTTPTNPLFLCPFFDAHGLVKEPNIKINEVSKNGTTFTIEIESSSIAPFMWLDAGDIRGRFSRNGFIQLQEKVAVQFYAWEEITLNAFQQALTLKSLTSKTDTKTSTFGLFEYIFYIFDFMKLFFNIFF